MKLSIYTYVRDGIRLDLHTEAMIRHHLPFADELVINECSSTDGTLELIESIDSPKIVIIRNRWTPDQSEPPLKEPARKRCSGDWCIALDNDEFIPEWEWQPIRDPLEHTSRLIVPMRYRNVYGNFRVYHARPQKIRWLVDKFTIHRNRPDIEFWGDGSHVRAVRENPEEFVRDDFRLYDYLKSRNAGS